MPSPPGHAASGPQRLAVALGPTAALATAGCSPDPALYDRLYTEADRVGVTDAGPVLAEVTDGTGGFSSPLPTLVLVIGGCDAYDQLVERFTAAGYLERSPAEVRATDTLVVDPAFTRVPHVPTDVQVTPGDGEATVSWALDPEAYWSFSWVEPSWTFLDLPNGEPFTFSLAQENDLGREHRSRPPGDRAERRHHRPPGRPLTAAVGVRGSRTARRRRPRDGDTHRPGPSRLAVTGGATALVLLVAAGAVTLGTSGVRRARRTADRSR